MKQALALIVSLLVAFTAAAIGGLATQRAPELYATLSRPDWAPPSSVFGPVWTVLYVLMAVAAWLVWREKGLRAAPVPFGLYGIQLLLNASGAGCSSRGGAGVWPRSRSLCYWP